MQANSTTKGRHLTAEERLRIERWHNQEKRNNRAIARLLNRSPQTINNEWKRGEVRLKTKTKYAAKQAQERYETKRLNSARVLYDEKNKSLENARQTLANQKLFGING